MQVEAQREYAVLPCLEGVDDYHALAAGLHQSTEVADWLPLAQRVEYVHDGRTMVWHHWQPKQTNGLPPVVLFHGGSGSWTHWVRSIGPLMAAGHDVWAVDLPGFGASDAWPDVLDADGMLAPLAQMLEAQFPLQAVRLVGFSFGGMTAAMLAAVYPHLIERLVLVGAPGMGLAHAQTFQLKGWRHLSDPQAQLEVHAYNLGALMLHNPSHIDYNALALHVANVRRDRLPRRKVARTDILARSLLRIECQVAAIYGACDALYPGTLGQVEAIMAANVRNWQGLQQVPDAGHWAQYENPHAFHAALLPLLAA